MNEIPRHALKLLVTAGPTREEIDPVRFISNYSTGKMGYEIAREAAGRAHSVVLASGPSCLGKPQGRVKTIFVESCNDMRKAVLKELKSCDALIMAAAVCDFRPAAAARRKIKKGQGSRVKVQGRRVLLELVENPDILLEAYKRKGRRILAGFALETEALDANARKKLKDKGLDFIVANRVTKERGVFGGGRSDYLIIDRSGKKVKYRRHSKKELARRIIDKVESLCYSTNIRQGQSPAKGRG